MGDVENSIGIQRRSSESSCPVIRSYPRNVLLTIGGASGLAHSFCDPLTLLERLAHRSQQQPAVGSRHGEPQVLVRRCKLLNQVRSAAVWSAEHALLPTAATHLMPPAPTDTKRPFTLTRLAAADTFA